MLSFRFCLNMSIPLHCTNFIFNPKAKFMTELEYMILFFSFELKAQAELLNGSCPASVHPSICLSHLLTFAWHKMKPLKIQASFFDMLDLRTDFTNDIGPGHFDPY